jgi:hypothetical protein
LELPLSGYPHVVVAIDPQEEHGVRFVAANQPLAIAGGSVTEPRRLLRGAHVPRRNRSRLKAGAIGRPDATRTTHRSKRTMMAGMNRKGRALADSAAGHGRNVGFPAANIELAESEMDLDSGVYTGVMRVTGDRARLERLAGISVGDQSTIGGETVVEVDLLDFQPDLRGRNVQALLGALPATPDAVPILPIIGRPAESRGRGDPSIFGIRCDRA